MKKISVIPYSLSVAGCILGAGYVSGQEVYQFFGAFGSMGLIGLALAMIIVYLCAMPLVKIVKSGVTEIDKVVAGENKILRTLAAFFEIFTFFGSYVVMAAGAGALFEQISGIKYSHFGGSLVFCLIISFIAVRGITGLIELFSKAVPVLITVTALVTVICLSKYGFKDFSIPVSDKFNPFIPNWFLGAVTFATYNFFCSIGVLTPLSLRGKTEKTIKLGTFFGVLILFAAGAAVIYSIAVTEGAAQDELPMLAVAESISPMLMYIFAAALFISMTGASLACIIPTVTYFGENFKVCEKHGAPTIFITSLAAFAFSCFGFSDLVGTLFSGLGYASIVAIAGLCVSFVKAYRKN